MLASHLTAQRRRGCSIEQLHLQRCWQSFAAETFVAVAVDHGETIDLSAVYGFIPQNGHGSSFISSLFMASPEWPQSLG